MYGYFSFILEIHQKLKKYGITVGVIMKKICPSVRPADCKIKIMPEPKIPANPVPEPKFPTMALGKPLQKPRVVLSPKALTVPKMIDDNREIQNDALY